MRHLVQDLKYAARMLWKSPGFTAVAVLSLALGVGANTTIFTLLNAVFLSPLPVKEPSTLVQVFTTDQKNTGAGIDLSPVSFPNFKDLREESDGFSGLSAYAQAGVSLSGGGEPEQVFTMLVTGNYFDVLGVKFANGRGFLPEEDTKPGANAVAVMSDRLWKRRYGGDRNLIGGTITVNGKAWTLVGVTPAGFNGTFAFGGPDLYVPTSMHTEVLGTLDAWFESRRALLFGVVGRLADGKTLPQAEASLKAIASRLESEYPKDNEKRSVRLLPLAQTAINPNQRELFVRSGGLLMTVVALVLLISCANVANLLLARSTVRQREIAIRVSLGAGRGRLVGQLLTESVVLSLLGGAVGLALAVWGRDLLWAFRPPFFAPDALDLSLGGRVLAFTAGLSIVTGLLFGLVPALQATRSDLITELKERGSQPGRHNRLFATRNLLVMAQMALSLIALIGSGLFLRSLGAAQKIDPGFDADRLDVISFDAASRGLDRAHGEEHFRRVLDRARSLPGVEAASLAANAPFGGGFMRSVFPEGRPSEDRTGILVLADAVTPGYFQAMGIPVLRGRDFTEADREGSPLVAIVNETMAGKFWPGEEAVGKRFRFHGDVEPREVVGVARDSKYITVGEDPRPYLYSPLSQNYQGNVTLFARASGDPDALLGTLRSEIQALDRDIPLIGVTAARDLIAQGFWPARMGAGLLAIFGLLALLLAAAGIYGVMSYSVNQRTREIGIRMAMGARPRDVLRLVLRQGMAPVLLGVGLGLGAAFWASRLVAGLLFGVSASDPLTFAAIPILLGTVALAASWLPARKATRVDPLNALRYE